MEAYPELLKLIKKEAKVIKWKNFAKNWRFYKKVKSGNGRRRIYLCGIKVLSYRPKPSLKKQVRDLSAYLYASNKQWKQNCAQLEAQLKQAEDRLAQVEDQLKQNSQKN